MKKITGLGLFFSVILAWPLQSEAVAGSTDTGAAASTFSSQVVGMGSYLNFLDGIVYQYQLLQLSESGGRTTYAIWFPPRVPIGLQPAVLMTEPYAGVEWSNDPVDQNWIADYNPALAAFPDVDGPYDSPNSGTIQFSPWEMYQIPPMGWVCLSHEVGVLLVFERFYAGGTIVDNVKDTTLGLEFLGQQNGIDPNHIGIFGFSWGGFEAIYGAANAPAGVVPAVGVAWSPPSDLSQFYQYVTQGLSGLIQNPNMVAQRQFYYDPYVRRIIAGTVTSVSPLSLDFSSFDLNFLKTNLKTKFLLLHDQWDTLVPFAQSVALAAALPDQVEGLWYLHVGPIDYNTLPFGHAPVSPGLEPDSASVFTSAYLLERLLPANAPIHIPYYSSDLASFFDYIRILQKQGVDISTILPRLNDLADPRVIMNDRSPAPGNLPPVPGSFWANYFLSLP
jgi:hypothetical protein